MYQLLGFEVGRTSIGIIAGTLLTAKDDKEMTREDLRRQCQDDLDRYVGRVDKNGSANRTGGDHDANDG